MANDSWEQAQFQPVQPDPGFDTPLVVHRHQGAPPAKVALVFVHGLGGQRYGTWGNYDGYILLGHSMGGLVCKGVVERLQAANDDKTLDKILGLMLLACPQLGTSRMPGIFGWFNQDARALKLFNPYVNDITDCFQNHVWPHADHAPTAAGARPIPIYAVVSASDLWVDRMSAGYGLPNSQILPLAGSHTKVVKPASSSDRAYLFVEKRIQSCLDRLGEQEKAALGRAAAPSPAAPPPENEADRDMLAYKAKVVDLRGSYEARNPGGRDRVCREGPGLADLIDNLDDRRLSSKRRVFKYQYGGWLQLLLARCTDDRKEGIAYARRGLERLEHSLALIEDFRKSHAQGGSNEEKSAYEFILEDDSHHRSRYLLATGKAILGRLGEAVSREDVRECLKPISESYKRKYPPEEDPTLRWAFEGSGDDGNEKT